MGRDLRVGRMMWCKNNNCYYYDRKKDKCKRVGKCGDNKGKKGVCWMDRSEGEY